MFGLCFSRFAPLPAGKVQERTYAKCEKSRGDKKEDEKKYQPMIR